MDVCDLIDGRGIGLWDNVPAFQYRYKLLDVCRTVPKGGKELSAMRSGAAIENYSNPAAGARVLPDWPVYRCAGLGACERPTIM